MEQRKQKQKIKSKENEKDMIGIDSAMEVDYMLMLGADKMQLPMIGGTTQQISFTKLAM